MNHQPYNVLGTSEFLCNTCVSEERRNPLTGESGRVQWPCEHADMDHVVITEPSYETDPVAALEADHPTPSLQMTDTYL